MRVPVAGYSTDPGGLTPAGGGVIWCGGGGRMEARLETEKM
jgi:hypothetical protein